MINKLIARLRSFSADTRGAIALEFVLVMPFLFWAFMAIYVFFDGYRQSSVNLKAAYTIGDLVSRETQAIDDDYVDSMHALLQVLTRATSPINLRITVVRWSEDDNRYYVDWSANRGFSIELTDGTIGDIEAKLPNMPDLERVILIETDNTFVPPFKVGMETKQLQNFVFTRPRFVDQVCGFEMSCADTS